MGRNNELDKMIIDLYDKGLSSCKISTIVGVSESKVLRVLKRNGIVIRPRNYKTYIVNENFFDIIDSELKAYWLGFIAADGHIHKNGKRTNNGLRIKLQLGDLNHLRKFAADIGSTYPIVVNVSNNFAYTHITSKHIKDSLKALGIKERKSWDLKPPKLKSDELMRAFWRGAIDGDGGICHGINSKGYGYRSVMFCGTIEMVNGFMAFVFEMTGATTMNYKCKSDTFSEVLYGTRENVRLVLKLLYDDSNIFLDRKKERATKLIGDLDGWFSKQKDK